MSTNAFIDLKTAKYITKNEPFSILSANVCSLNSNKVLLNQMLDEIGNPDIISLCEIRHPTTISSYIPQYNFFSAERKKSRGGGVGLWIKSSIQSKQIKEISSIKTTSIEFVHALVQYGPKRIIFVSIYRPPQAKVVQSINEISNIIKVCLNQNLPLLISGDFNIDLLKENAVTDRYEDMLLSNQMTQLVNSPTRIAKTSSTLIDHVLVSSTLRAHASVINTCISDHLPILTSLNTRKTATKEELQKLTRINTEKAIEKVKLINWNEWLDQTKMLNANDTFASLHKKIAEIVNMQSETVTKKRRQNPRNPWISRDALKLRTKANMHRKKLATVGSEYHDRMYRYYHSQYKNCINKDKFLYYSKKVKDAGKNSKMIWSTINEVLNRKPKKPLDQKVPELSMNGHVIKNPTEVCEVFNTHFQGAAVALAETIPEPSKPFDYYLELTPTNYEPFEILEVTEESVSKVIEKLKPKKSYGFDKISKKFVKAIAPNILKPLTSSINKCINESVFPTILKTAKIKPLHKRDDPKNPSNYRQICQLSSFSSIVEGALYQQCKFFNDEHNVLHDHQIGFREKHSCNHALMLTMNKIERAQNNRQFTILLSLDLSMAFDTINNDTILPAKLKHYYKDSKTCKLLSSFFSERKQFVQINEFQSSTINSKNISVIQGSSMGPPSFSLYINDLPNITSMFTVLFADDTNFILSDKNFDKLVEKVNEELEIINDFMIANKLSINKKKTTYMIFPPKNKTYNKNVVIKIGNQIIEQSKEIKFLGIHIDQKLKFNTQFENVHKKLKQGVLALNAVKWQLPFRIKLQIYHSLIHSNAMYCPLIWLQKLPATKIKTLQTLQNRAIRALFCARYNCHTSKMYDLSRITRIDQICERESIILMHDFKESKLPNAIMNMISDATRREIRATRSQDLDNLHIGKSYKKDDLMYSIITHWNKSDCEVKNLSISKKSVAQRVTVNLINKNNQVKCTRIECHSCKHEDEEVFYNYMKKDF